jgi:hypothetical protein
MTETVITNTFPKEPRETVWVTVSFAEQLAANGDQARAVNPIEMDTVPPGITLGAQVFTPETGRLNLLVIGGVDGQRYPLTMWMNTTSGQRLEHQITIKVKELLK